jgi:hypothetical protein
MWKLLRTVLRQWRSGASYRADTCYPAARCSSSIVVFEQQCAFTNGTVVCNQVSLKGPPKVEFAALLLAIFRRYVIAALVLGLIAVEISEEPWRSLGFIAAIFGALLILLYVLAWTDKLSKKNGR